MIVIAEAMWSPGPSNDMGKAFLEGEPLPDYIEMQGSYTNSFIGEGFRSIVIYKFDAAKYEGAHKIIGKDRLSIHALKNFFKN